MAFQQFAHGGTIMQKVEELREWQRQQQEKLLQQQEEQRMLLNKEQQRMYQVFGLQNGNILLGKNAVTLNCSSQLDTCSEASEHDDKDSVVVLGFAEVDNPCHNDRNIFTKLPLRYDNVDDIPLSAAKKDNFQKRVLIMDEVPVISPKKDFHQLLQEKLEQYDDQDINQNLPGSNEKPKKKFLKKGEGLARFRMKPTQFQHQQQSSGKGSVKKKVVTKPHAPNNKIPKKGPAVNGKSENNASTMTKNSRNNIKPKQHNRSISNSKGESSETSKSQYPKTAMTKLTLNRNESLPTWAHVLSQQNRPNMTMQNGNLEAQQKTVFSQNSPSKDSIELSFIEKIKDAEKKNKAEIDELKVFELLEEHADNSSFCSTSSLVARLMEGSIISTPVKNHPFRSSQNQNGIRHVQPHQSYFPKDYSNQEKILSGSHQLNLKNVLPYGLDVLDGENGKPENGNFKRGRYPENGNLKSESSINGNKQWETNSGSTSLNTSVNSVNPNDNSESLYNRSLHVRFSENNEYKSVSDTSFSSQSETSQNTSCKIDCSSQKVDTGNKNVSTSSKRFQDDQAWSDDDCSCTSSDDSKSPETSLNVSNHSLDVKNCQNILQTSEQLRQTNRGNDHRETDIATADTDTYPTDLNKDPYFVLHRNHPPDNDWCKTDIGINTENESDNEIVFKSSLLRTRLEELEKEIEIFRKENANLQKLKKKHEEEVMKYNRERKDLEKKMDEEKEKMESLLKEERKKLNKEKSVFEKYCKDLRNQPSKQEREEIQALKQKLTDLQEEMHKKDSRWSAGQIRTRDRIKQLEQDNMQLKQEVEKLKKGRNQSKSVKSVASGRNRGISSTRVIHAINEHIAKIKPSDLEDSIIVHDVVPTKKIPVSVLQQHKHPQKKSKQHNVIKSNEWGNGSNKAYQTFQDIPDLKPKPSADDLLQIQDGSISPNLVTNHKLTNSSNKDSLADKTVRIPYLMHDISYSSEGEVEEEVEDSNRPNTEVSTNAALDNNKIHMAVYNAFFNANLKSDTDGRLRFNTDANDIFKNDPINSTQLRRNNEEYVDISDNIHEHNSNSKTLEEIYRADCFDRTNSEQENISKYSFPSSAEGISDVATPRIQNYEPDDKEVQNSSGGAKPSANREKVYPDGRKEIWYTNGNLKKISADGSTVKIIYYNGDVKETLNDGTVKYFYAETRTWHTTNADGSEVLEYSDGQVERLHKDGTKEITYPNATVRTCYTDGREEWVFQDGLVVKINEQPGEKVLLLPNGQREVHTKEHMRREYPDGTVKIVYPDGVQETRYTNGRIRVKDKDGKLIMDSIMQRL